MATTYYFHLDGTLQTTTPAAGWSFLEEHQHLEGVELSLDGGATRHALTLSGGVYAGTVLSPPTPQSTVTIYVDTTGVGAALAFTMPTGVVIPADSGFGYSISAESFDYYGDEAVRAVHCSLDHVTIGEAPPSPEPEPEPSTSAWTDRAPEPAIEYDIQPQYERALGGLHPAYFSDVTVLAHDGWHPSWSLMWADRESIGATWSNRAHVAASWTRRDSF